MRKRSNCFGCGNKLKNKRNNVFYCRDCSKIITNAHAIINRTLRNKKYGNRFKNYDFKINIEILKKARERI